MNYLLDLYINYYIVKKKQYFLNIKYLNIFKYFYIFFKGYRFYRV